LKSDADEWHCELIPGSDAVKSKIDLQNSKVFLCVPLVCGWHGGECSALRRGRTTG
jgi:hypothetical protein